MPPLLSVKNLRVSLRDPQNGSKGWVLRGLDLDMAPGERVALVGESGCGKSVTALTLMGLLPSPPMEWEEGEVHFQGTDLRNLSAAGWRGIRGARLSMVFQDPFSSLNPAFTAGEQVLEALGVHGGGGPQKDKEKVLGLFREVGLSDPQGVYHQYPHQLSGGMCQRVMIAMALACGPALLIADEPTTALDVTVQAQILGMLFDMTERHRLGLLFITHNLPLAREFAHRVVILYAGRIVEVGTPGDIFNHPRHPYTEGLLAAQPDPGQKDRPLANIPGQVPSPFAAGEGCGFAPRCPRADEKCRREFPELMNAGEGHSFRCFYPSDK